MDQHLSTSHKRSKVVGWIDLSTKVKESQISANFIQNEFMWISQLSTNVKALKVYRLEVFIIGLKLGKNDVINIQKYRRKYGEVKFNESGTI